MILLLAGGAMPNISRSLVIAALLSLSATGSSADVQLKQLAPPSNLVILQISNKISQKDAADVAQLDFRGKALWVYLNSPGGDVDAAIRIGQIIRKNEAQVTVVPRANCFSSCALIYIAGTTRTNEGVIGLHRPYLSSAPLSQEAIERQVPLMLQKIKDYVQSMGVTDLFYQEMVNTEPSDVRLYRAEAIKRLVPENDATQDEIDISFRARLYGIDTAEMRRRNLEADAKCASLTSDQSHDGHNRWSRCWEAALWGLSETVYEERERKRSQVCKMSDEDTKILTKLDRRSAREFPPLLKLEVCIRNVMLSP
jgi:hypothetical protein